MIYVKMDEPKTIGPFDILQALVTQQTDDAETVQTTDSQLKLFLERGYSLLSTEQLIRLCVDRMKTNSEKGLRWEYLHFLLYFLNEYYDTIVTPEDVEQSEAHKLVISKVVKITIILGIHPSVSWHVELHGIFMEITEPITDIQKYSRLVTTVMILFKFFIDKDSKVTFLEYTVMEFVDDFFAALLHLAYYPEKPGTKVRRGIICVKSLAPEVSTEQLSYFVAKWIANGEEELRYNEIVTICESNFETLVRVFLGKCKPALRLRKLFMVSCFDELDWAHHDTRPYLSRELMRLNSVGHAMKGLLMDVSRTFYNEKLLDIAARTIIGYRKHHLHDGYMEHVCTEILSLLKSNLGHPCFLIGVYLVKIVYEASPVMCQRYIFQNMFDPLNQKSKNFNSSEVLSNEQSVLQSVHSIYQCFISTQYDFKRVPIENLLQIAVPLFCCFVYACQYGWRHYVLIKEIMEVLVLDHRTQRSMFDIFFNYSKSTYHEDFGPKVVFRGGPEQGLKVTGGCSEINFECIHLSLCRLIIKDKKAMINLVMYLQETLSHDSRRQLARFHFQLTIYDHREIIRYVNKIYLMEIFIRTLYNEKISLYRLNGFYSEFGVIITCLYNVICWRTTRNIESKDYCDTLLEVLLIAKRYFNNHKLVDDRLFKDFLPAIQNLVDQNALTGVICNEINKLNEILHLRVSYGRKIYPLINTDMPDPYLMYGITDEREIDKFVEHYFALFVNQKNARKYSPISTASEVVANKYRILPRTERAAAFNEYLAKLSGDKSNIYDYLAGLYTMGEFVELFPNEVITYLVNELRTLPFRYTIEPHLYLKTRENLGKLLLKLVTKLGPVMIANYAHIIFDGFLAGVKSPYWKVRLANISYIGSFCKYIEYDLEVEVIERLAFALLCVGKTDDHLVCQNAALFALTEILIGSDSYALLHIDVFYFLRMFKNMTFTEMLGRNDPITLQQLTHLKRAMCNIDDGVEKKCDRCDNPS